MLRHGSVLVTNSLDSTRPSYQHRFRPRRSRNVACSPRNDSLLRTALALQQLAYVRLAVRASNQIDPPVNPTYCQNRDIDLPTTTLQQCSIQSTYDSLLRTTLALQHLTHVRLAVRASNQIDTSPVNPTNCQNRDIDLPNTTDLSYPQRSSSCIQRLDRPQLPATIIQLHPTTRPTSATRNDRPAVFNDSTDLSFPQRSSSCILRLDRPQLPATIVRLYLHDSAYASYPHRTFRCAQLRLDHTSYRHHPSS